MNSTQTLLDSDGRLKNGRRFFIAENFDDTVRHYPKGTKGLAVGANGHTVTLKMENPPGENYRDKTITADIFNAELV